MSPTEAHDFNRLWYRRFTEETYKECYELDQSDSYEARTADPLDEEPEGVDSVTYPENKVVKYGDITVEYDKTNDEYRVTTIDGSYLTIGAQGVILKSMNDSYDGTKGKKIIETIDGVKLITGATLEKMVLGDTLKSYLDTVKTWLDSHIHTAPVIGATSTPPAPSPSPQVYLSQKNKVD